MYFFHRQKPRRTRCRHGLCRWLRYFWRSTKINKNQTSRVEKEEQNQVSHGRCWCVLVFFALFFGFISWNVYALQTEAPEQYRQEALSIASSSRKTYGVRGQILDFNEQPLVGNLRTQNIYFEPKRLKQMYHDEVIDIFVRELGLSRDVLQERFAKALDAPVEVNVCDNLSSESAELIGSWNYASLKLVPPAAPEQGWTLKLLPQHCTPKELEAVILEIVPFVGKGRKAIEKLVKKAQDKPREIIIGKDIPYADAERAKDSLRQWSCEFKRRVRVPYRTEESIRRCYLQGSLMANILGEIRECDVQIPGRPNGVTKRQLRGISGVEKMMDDIMQPREGREKFFKDNRGRLLEMPVVVASAVDGADVFLTIQAPIQAIVEEELQKVVEEYAPERAYAIMMDPRSGAIMALAQYPFFDPENPGKLADKADEATRNAFLKKRSNHFLTECFEPGSIMKCLPVAYALDQDLVTLDTLIDCEESGKWRYGGETLHDTHHNGVLTVAQIIERSSNIGTAKIAVEKMGNDALYRALKGFGIGSSTQLGYFPAVGGNCIFAGETWGLLPDVKRWRTITPTRLTIGQSVNVTALQMLQAYAAIANGGVMMQPYLVDRIRLSDGTVKNSIPKVKGQPISARSAQQITQAMIPVVHGKPGEATGRRARISGYTVAGKTGTAQILVDGRYKQKYFTSSFIGFVPAENPAFTLIVTVKGVSKHGGTVCGPVFKAISERTLTYLDIQPLPEDQTGMSSSLLQTADSTMNFNSEPGHHALPAHHP